MKLKGSIKEPAHLAAVLQTIRNTHRRCFLYFTPDIIRVIAKGVSDSATIAGVDDCTTWAAIKPDEILNTGYNTETKKEGLAYVCKTNASASSERNQNQNQQDSKNENIKIAILMEVHDVSTLLHALKVCATRGATSTTSTYFKLYDPFSNSVKSCPVLLVGRKEIFAGGGGGSTSAASGGGSSTTTTRQQHHHLGHHDFEQEVQIRVVSVDDYQDVIRIPRIVDNNRCTGMFSLKENILTEIMPVLERLRHVRAPLLTITFEVSMEQIHNLYWKKVEMENNMNNNKCADEIFIDPGKILPRGNLILEGKTAGGLDLSFKFGGIPMSNFPAWLEREFQEIPDTLRIYKEGLEKEKRDRQQQRQQYQQQQQHHQEQEGDGNNNIFEVNDDDDDDDEVQSEQNIKNKLENKEIELYQSFREKMFQQEVLRNVNNLIHRDLRHARREEYYNNENDENNNINNNNFKISDVWKEDFFRLSITIELKRFLQFASFRENDKYASKYVSCTIHPDVALVLVNNFGVFKENQFSGMMSAGPQFSTKVRMIITAKDLT